MLNRRQIFGLKSEEVAAKFIQKNGYKILCRNFKTKIGEIDLIAEEDGTIVFIEVKARKTQRFGSPKYAITQKKQRKISQVALYYLKNNPKYSKKARFDVITVGESSKDIRIIKNAFELAY